MVYAQPRICPGGWEAQISLGFWETNVWSNLAQTTRPSDSHKKEKKKNLLCRELCYPTHHWLKLKESEKRDKYLELARELKKLNMRVTVIPVVIGAPEAITKGLVQGLEDLEIRGRVDTIQTTA